MPRTSTLSSVELDVLEESRRAEPVDPETPFRILVAGDFSGGAGKNRRAIEIDRDNFDAVMERVAPELRLPFGNAEVAVKFRELDDFDPDRLFQESGAVSETARIARGTRRRLDRAAEGRDASASMAAGEVARPASGADLLRDMMGEPATPAAAPVRRSDWDQMLHDIVAPYAVAGRQSAQGRDGGADGSRDRGRNARALAPCALSSARSGVAWPVFSGATPGNRREPARLPRRSAARGAHLGRVAPRDGDEPWGVIAGLIISKPPIRIA